MRTFLILSAMSLLALPSCKKGNGSSDPIPHNKALVWDKNFGGSEYDMILSSVQLPDGYAFTGATRSTDGDISGSRIGYDYWLSKVDNNGTKLWSKTFGINHDEYGKGIINTQDGGLLVVGYSFQPPQNIATAIKTDANGNLQWEKRISQSTDAKPMSIIQSGDGGFIVAGYEKTGRGDLDGWVAKLAQDGSVSWTKNFGGTGEDQFSTIVRLSDGSLAVSGYSKSNSGDLTNNRGGFDGWVMKLDGNGNKLWSQSYGGTNDDFFKGVTMADGGIVAAGYTTSNNGDISGSKGGHEAWIMKVDGNGSKQWSKTYGGLNEEYVASVTRTNDGGFIMAGHTNSTTGDVVRRDNDFGCWVIKTDGNGNKTATSTYGTRFDEFIDQVITTTDGGYLISGHMWVEGKGYNGLLIKLGAL